ncbi:MAG: hypothetical protein ACRDT8_25210, partial [Micromonosporaceae bacterium]
RLSGHRRPGLAEVLDATAGAGAARAVGGFLGSFALAMAVPVAAYLGLVAVTAVEFRSVATLGAGVVAVLTVLLPGGLALGAFSVLLGVVAPAALARVVTAAGWVWATVSTPWLAPYPTVTGTVLSPLGRYPAAEWLHGSPWLATYGLDGPLRPEVDTWSALLAVLAPVVAAACFLALTWIRLARST